MSAVPGGPGGGGAARRGTPGGLGGPCRAVPALRRRRHVGAAAAGPRAGRLGRRPGGASRRQGPGAVEAAGPGRGPGLRGAAGKAGAGAPGAPGGPRGRRRTRGPQQAPAAAEAAPPLSADELHGPSARW